MNFIGNFSRVFRGLLKFTGRKAGFIFNDVGSRNLTFFFLGILYPVIFVSTLVNVLRRVHILPIVVHTVNFLLSGIGNVNGLRSFGTIDSLVLNRSRGFVTCGSVLNGVSHGHVCAVTTATVSAISVSVINTCVAVLRPGCIITTLMLGVFDAFVILSLVGPCHISTDRRGVRVSGLRRNRDFFRVLNRCVLTNFGITVVITTVLVNFVTLVTTLGTLFTAIAN